MSELPFLKDKKNLGAGTVEVRDADQSSDEMLMEQIGSELLEAFEKRDIKSIREAIHALTNMLKEQEDAASRR